MIRSSPPANTLLRRVVHLLSRRFGSDRVAVALVEDDWVRCRACSTCAPGQPDDDASGTGHKVAMGEGIVGKVARSGETLRVGDLSEGPETVKPGSLEQTRSELAVPLVHQEQVLGVLHVQSRCVDAFGPADQQLVELVAALVAPAVHISRLYERWRRRTRYLHLLSEIGRMVMSAITQENVVEVACESILEVLDVSFVGIALLDPESQRAVHAGHATRLPFKRQPRFTVAVGEGVVGRVIAAGESIRVGNTTKLEDFVEVVPGMLSAASVPMRIRGRVIGVLDVEHSLPDHFDDEDLRLLENLAVYLAQALENAQLFDSQRRRWQQLLVINEATRIATEPLALDDIVTHVAREVHDRFGYFAVAVWLCEDREVVLRAACCEEKLALQPGHRFKLGESVVGQVAKTGVVLLADPQQQDGPPGTLHDGIRSTLSVPLRSQNGVTGVITVQSREPNAFGPEDQLLMETLARSVSGAISNARSIAATEELREDLNRMIVHDLRNPVQSVLCTLQEVQRAAEGKLPHKVIESVQAGLSCTEDILGMVNSMLDITRFDAGKILLKLMPAALNDHIRAGVRKFAAVARAKRIQITMVLSQEVPVVRVDYELLDRTIANLVGNALKFTPEGARITIRSEYLEEARDGCKASIPCVMVTVQDTGEGIPEAYHDKIFEKYGQVESRKAGLKMSTGLGLALCRYVVEAHGGAIWVDSSPGKGSSFRFTLPVQK